MYRKQLPNGEYALYNGSFLRLGDTTIVNPTEQMLIDNGYEYFIPEPAPINEPAAVEILEAVKHLNASTLATLDDEAALDVAALFPTWFSKLGQAVTADERYWYNGKLYRCVQAHTTQADWTPDITPALWTEVSVESWPEIPGTITAENAWMQGQKGTWKEQHYICQIDNCVWNPDQYAAAWLLVD